MQFFHSDRIFIERTVLSFDSPISAILGKFLSCRKSTSKSIGPRNSLDSHYVPGQSRPAIRAKLALGSIRAADCAITVAADNVMPRVADPGSARARETRENAFVLIALS